MNFKASLVKTAIKITPNKIVILVANVILKGIAKLSKFIFDLETRIAYVQLTLYGETEPIEVKLDGFAIITDEESHRLIIQKASSNKPWLNNLLSKIVLKPWKIPNIPKYKRHIDFVAELFKPGNTELEEDVV